MNDLIKETKARILSVEERQAALQKVAALEAEIKEHVRYRATVEEVCKRHTEVQAALKVEAAQKADSIAALRNAYELQQRRLEDDRREIGHERKMTREWQVRCTKLEKKTEADSAAVRSFPHLLESPQSLRHTVPRSRRRDQERQVGHRELQEHVAVQSV